MNVKHFNPKHIRPVADARHWMKSDDTWEQEKEKFKAELRRIDAIRGESFEKVFPELAPLLDL